MYVCMYVRTYLSMYVCTYVRMYVCMYVRIYLCMCVCTYVCIVYFLFYLVSMLHYFGVILHAVIYMSVSFAGDAVTSIMASVTAFPLQF